MKGIICAMFFAALVTGCSKPKVEITFHHSPSDTEKIVSDVKSALTNHGMRAWNHEWINSKILALRIDTDKNQEQFKEAISKTFNPVLWKPGKTSELRIHITENSKNVLRLLKLKEDQVITVNLNWDNADYGLFGIQPTVHEPGNTSTIFSCSVRVPVIGDIPELTYRYEIDNPDTLTNPQGASGFVKFFQTINRLNPTASYAATLSDYHGDDTPWSKVGFANRTHSRPRNISNGQEANSKEVEVKDALFIFAPCQTSQRNADILGKYSFIASSCPEFTDETCAQKIRELSNGDFYGVTGYEISGNVEKYKATW